MDISRCKKQIILPKWSLKGSKGKRIATYVAGGRAISRHACPSDIVDDDIDMHAP